jgi:hypothetical protein
VLSLKQTSELLQKSENRNRINKVFWSEYQWTSENRLSQSCIWMAQSCPKVEWSGIQQQGKQVRYSNGYNLLNHLKTGHKFVRYSTGSSLLISGFQLFIVFAFRNNKKCIFHILNIAVHRRLLIPRNVVDLNPHLLFWAPDDSWPLSPWLFDRQKHFIITIQLWITKTEPLPS